MRRESYEDVDPRFGHDLSFPYLMVKRGRRAVYVSDAVVSELRDILHDRVPALRVEFVQILQDMIGDLSGNPSPVEVKLFSERPAAFLHARDGAPASTIHT